MTEIDPKLDLSGLIVTGRMLLEQEWTDEDRAAYEQRTAELGERLLALEAKAQTDE